ncbi:phage major capsid protein [Streptomyces sp. NPDC001260]|uniref:phage major capsid protein n=1 Tax=Streptomyces sp. NPDC001260 TaxID=3364551 RepID=UPI00368F10D0
MPRNNRLHERREENEFETIAEARAVLEQLHAEHGDAELPDGDARETWDAAEQFIRRGEESQRRLTDLYDQGAYDRGLSGLTERREEGDQWLSRGERVLDDLSGRELLSDESRDKLQRAIDDTRGHERQTVGKYLSLLGDDAYARAFTKVMSGETGHLRWTPEEHAAYQAVEMNRSALGVGAAGNGAGYAVPLVLDPSVNLTSGGSINPVRQVANVISIVGDRWVGVNSEGVVADWTLEGREVPATELSFDQPAITTRKYSAFVVYSFELEGDWTGLLKELQAIFSDAVDNQQAAAFAHGAGPADGEFAEPEGLVTALSGSASELYTLDYNSFLRDDLLALRYAVPARFRANAKVLGALEILDQIREFPAIESSTGDVSLLTEGNPPSFRGWPVYEYSELGNDSTFAGDSILVAGDFNRGYKIVAGKCSGACSAHLQCGSQQANGATRRIALGPSWCGRSQRERASYAYGRGSGIMTELIERSWEFRADESDGRNFSGYAAVFNSPAVIRGANAEFTERIARGAFAQSLRERTPVLQFDHGRDPHIGHLPIGQIQELREDEHGLFVQARLFTTPRVDEVREAIATGSIKGMSFRFSVNDEAWNNARTEREIRSVELVELGPVVFPAYASTSAGVRSSEVHGLPRAERAYRLRQLTLDSLDMHK